MESSNTSLYCLIYISSASRPLDSDELNAILSASRVNNSALGITGMLVYSQGNIIQVLEGNSDTIEALYQKIGLDPRHFGVIRLIKKPIEQRSFGEWSMGFRTMNSEQMQEIKQICQEGLSDQTEGERIQDKTVLTMIKDFVANNM